MKNEVGGDRVGRRRELAGSDRVALDRVILSYACVCVCVCGAVGISIVNDTGKSRLLAEVTQNVVYSCQAVNDAGLSNIRSCNVTAVPPGTRTSQLLMHRTSGR